MAAEASQTSVRPLGYWTAFELPGRDPNVPDGGATVTTAVGKTFLAVLVELPSGDLMASEEEAEEMAETERRSAEAKAAAQASAATDAANAPSKEKPSVKLGEWWKNARTIGSGPKDASIVKCTVGGSVQFMRVHDCEMRGGTVGS